MVGQLDWASRLSERVTIERPSATGDELGGQTISWETVVETWAEVQPVSLGAREHDDAAQVAALAGYRVRLRSRSDLDASMRLQWRGHVLAIHSLHEQEAIVELLAYEEAL